MSEEYLSLSSATIASYSAEILAEKIAEASRRRLEMRARLAMELAGIANQAGSLPMLAERMGVSEVELARVITLQLVRDNNAFLVSFLLLCGTEKRTIDAILAQFQALDLTEKAHVRLVNERYKRKDRALEQEREKEREEQARIFAKRVRARAVVEPAIADVAGRDSKPNPLDAQTEEEFVDTMRRYRVWAKNPSLREMSQSCGQKISHSTFRNMLNAQTVPRKLDLVDTFVTVLGGTQEDRMRWATAWRHFTVPAPQQVNVEPPVLRLTGS
ncbi:hypothetical protein [Microtetraspora sp. NBRC 13810]|uniref:hypothetical protein n=1 Tax=Microtetraspora sp. NBRC 13810 TaxID=3030990 RepID=UPI002556F08B|nr:hypothetical protein [Microtetraspora sp. NBRC 13810]